MQVDILRGSKRKEGPECPKPWKSVFHNSDHNLTKSLALVSFYSITCNLSDHFYCNVHWQP